MKTNSNETLRQQLAAIEHERWASWQSWLHSQLKRVPEGLLVTPEYYEHLEYQIAADYDELTDKEKASDMEQVDRYWPLVEAYIASQRKEAQKQLIDELQKEYTHFTWGHYDPFSILEKKRKELDHD